MLDRGRMAREDGPTVCDRAPSTCDRAPSTCDRAPSTCDRVPSTCDRAPMEREETAPPSPARDARPPPGQPPPRRPPLTTRARTGPLVEPEQMAFLENVAALLTTNPQSSFIRARRPRQRRW